MCVMRWADVCVDDVVLRCVVLCCAKGMHVKMEIRKWTFVTITTSGIIIFVYGSICK